MRSLERIDSFGAQHVGAMVINSEGETVAVRGDHDYQFPLASVTKLLATMSVFVAVEERVLSLDDHAGPPGATLRHLLAHASGLGMYDPHIALAQPGAKRIYSNAGFEVLGIHLALKAGMSFDEYLQSGVLQPLGMDSTNCVGSPAAAGVATLFDIGRFAAELLRPTLIGDALLTEAKTVAFPGLVGIVPGFGRQDPCDWGLGFELKSQKSPHWTGKLNSPRSFGHFGQSGTFVLIDPDAGYGLVMLSDRPFEQWAKEQWPVLCDDVYNEFVHG